MEKILYLEAVEVIPLKNMPRLIRENGGYRVMLTSGKLVLVDKKDFLKNYESISEEEKLKLQLRGNV